MVDFAAHFTIHTIKQAFKNTYSLLESVVLETRYLPIACQSERSLHYFNLDRISNWFAIHRSSSHMLLVAEKRFNVAW